MPLENALLGTYDFRLVALSVLIAMLASYAALDLGGRVTASRGRLRFIWLIGGSVAMGMGIWSMHYIGMLAYSLPVPILYHWPTVLLSLLAAILASAVALFVASRNDMGPLRTGMAAATFRPTAAAVDLTRSVEISSLGIVGIGGVTAMTLVLAILTSFVDRRFSAQALELQLSEQSYRQLAESVQVILWRGGVDTSQFSYINQEAEDLLGYPIREWTSTPAFWVDHLHTEDRELAESCCKAAVENGGAQRFEHRMVAADGRVVWLRTSVRLVAGNEAAKELVGVMTDITERKRAQEAAEKASAAKSELLSEIKRLNGQLKQENTRMSDELGITKRLQQMILPRDEDMRNAATLDISGFMEPAAEVGGDYYDVVAKDGGVFFGIGDVTGHGLESGVIAIMVQTAVRTLLASGQHENRKFFDVLNRVIFGNTRRMNCDRNLTFSLLHYQDSVVTISGQHEEVLVVRSNGVLERHDTLNLGFQLGLVEDISSFIGETRVPLQPGDVMVAYTDGITEAMNCAGVTFGIERLSEAVKTSHGQPAYAIREAVLSSLREYIGRQHLADDISLLVVKPA